jgi:hypothetical protein
MMMGTQPICRRHASDTWEVEFPEFAPGPISARDFE